MNHSALSLLNASLLATGMEQTPADSPVRELTARLAQGDDLAWAQFHREYGPGIFRQLLAATRGDYDLASEALQQTYLRVARYARPCASAPMFSGWLRVVARSVLHDCRRRRGSFWKLLHRRYEDPTDAVQATAEEADRLFGALDTALDQLGTGERTLLEAKYFAGADVRTLADRLAISPKAVESRLTRARLELRRHLLAALSRHE